MIRSSSWSARATAFVVVLLVAVLGGCADRGVRPPPRPSPVVVNVMEFGATGDGVTDDRPAIQAALDRAAAAGASVYFPPGSFRLGSASAPLNRILITRPNQHLVGAGRDASRLVVGASFGDYVTVIGAEQDQVGTGTWSMRGLTIDQNARSGNALVSGRMLQYPKMALRLGDYDAAARVTVSESGFADSDSVNTLYLFAAQTGVTNNRFTGIGGPVGLTPHDHSTVYLTATVPEGVQQIADNAFSGIRSSGGATTAIETHGGVQQITGNQVSDYLRGMNVTGIAEVGTSRVHVGGNTIERAAIGVQLWSQVVAGAQPGLGPVELMDNGIGLDGAAWAIAGTMIPTAGVLLNSSNTAPVVGLTISGNHIRFTSTNPAPQLKVYTAGISCRVDTPSAQPQGLTVRGNTFVGAPSAIEGSCVVDGALVRDNTISG